MCGIWIPWRWWKGSPHEGVALVGTSIWSRGGTLPVHLGHGWNAGAGPPFRGAEMFFFINLFLEDVAETVARALDAWAALAAARAACLNCKNAAWKIPASTCCATLLTFTSSKHRADRFLKSRIANESNRKFIHASNQAIKHIENCSQLQFVPRSTTKQVISPRHCIWLSWMHVPWTCCRSSCVFLHRGLVLIRWQCWWGS